MPAAPASNGVPAIGVSVPSAWRSKPEIVLCPAVLLLTYTWPVTDPFDAATPEAGPSRRAVTANRSATSRVRRCMGSPPNPVGLERREPWAPRMTHV